MRYRLNNNILVDVSTVDRFLTPLNFERNHALKLIRLSDHTGKAIPCLLDRENQPRDVSALVADFTLETISPSLFARLLETNLSSIPRVDPLGHCQNKMA